MFPCSPPKYIWRQIFPFLSSRKKRSSSTASLSGKSRRFILKVLLQLNPAFCGSCLSIRVIVLTVVSIIELLRWAAAADKSPFALVIGASWVRVRFSDSATGRPLKMCYLLCNATIQMKLWGVWSFLKDAKSAAGPYVVGRRVSSHGPAFLCPLICDLSIFSPTLLQGLVALPALF